MARRVLLNQENFINKIELSPIEDYRERIRLPNNAINYLKDIREINKLTQAEVVNKLGKSKNYIYELENKYKNIYLKSLKGILNLYKINEEQFFKNYNINKTASPNYINQDLSQIAGYFAGDAHIST